MANVSPTASMSSRPSSALRIPPSHVIPGHKSWSRACAIANSPYASIALSVGDDSTGRVWNAETGKPITNLSGHLLNMKDCSISWDGLVAATAGRDGSVRVWNTAAGSQITKFEIKGGTNTEGCVLTPDGFTLVAIFSNKLLRKQGKDCWLVVCDVRNDEIVYTWHFSPAKLMRCAVSNDASVIAVSVWSKNVTSEVRAIDSNTGGTLKRWTCPLELKPGVAIDGAGERILIADGCYLRICNVHGTEDTRILSSNYCYNTCDLNADGTRAFATDQFHYFHIWDVQNGEMIGALSPHPMRTRGCAISPDGRKAVTSSDDCRVRVWDLSQLDLLEQPDVPTTSTDEYITAKHLPRQRWHVSSSDDRRESSPVVPARSTSSADTFSKKSNYHQEYVDPKAKVGSLDISGSEFAEHRSSARPSSFNHGSVTSSDAGDYHGSLSKPNGERDPSSSMLSRKGSAGSDKAGGTMDAGDEVSYLSGAFQHITHDDNRSKLKLDGSVGRFTPLSHVGPSSDSSPPSSGTSSYSSSTRHYLRELAQRKSVSVAGSGSRPVSEELAKDSDFSKQGKPLKRKTPSPRSVPLLESNGANNLDAKEPVMIPPSHVVNSSELWPVPEPNNLFEFPQSDCRHAERPVSKSCDGMLEEGSSISCPFSASTHYSSSGGHDEDSERAIGEELELLECSDSWRAAFANAAGGLGKRISVRQAAKITAKLARSVYGDKFGSIEVLRSLERNHVEELYARRGCRNAGFVVDFETFIVVAHGVMTAAAMRS